MTTQKKAKRKKSKNLIKFYRLLFSLVFLVVIFYLIEDKSIEEIDLNGIPSLYSNVCHDNLERVFTEAIKGAQHSILLIIYSLNDSQVIAALNRQADKGIDVKVIYDPSTPLMGFQALSARITKEKLFCSGLMHQKILVIDSEKIWMGSANLTTDSLKMHDNLVVGLLSPTLAQAIEKKCPFIEVKNSEQSLEYWELPSMGHEGLKRLLEMLAAAQKSVRIAMYTWTHPDLTEAVIKAHQRGVEVEVVCDRTQAQGVGHKTIQRLIQGGIHVRLSMGLGLLHHKFAWIDETILINGSANWTQAAFSRNRDCFLILYPLTADQKEKMQQLWKKTRAASLLFSVLELEKTRLIDSYVCCE